MPSLIIDGSGSVAMGIGVGRFMSLLPLTVYQLERFFWTQAPQWSDEDGRPLIDDYEGLLNALGIPQRPDPDEIGADSLVNETVLRGLSFNMAVEICAGLLKGRVPSEGELQNFRHEVENGEYVKSFRMAEKFLREVKKPFDSRMLMLYKKVARNPAAYINRILCINVLTTQFPYDSNGYFGNIYSVSLSNNIPPARMTSRDIGLRDTAVFYVVGAWCMDRL